MYVWFIISSNSDSLLFLLLLWQSFIHYCCVFLLTFALYSSIQHLLPVCFNKFSVHSKCLGCRKHIGHLYVWKNGLLLYVTSSHVFCNEAYYFVGILLLLSLTGVFLFSTKRNRLATTFTSNWTRLNVVLLQVIWIAAVTRQDIDSGKTWKCYITNDILDVTAGGSDTRIVHSGADSGEFLP